MSSGPRATSTEDVAPLAINALCLALAIVALAVSLTAGSFTLGIGDGPAVGLRLTTLSSVLLVLILGLGLVVGSFSHRYTVDDPNPRRLAWLILLATMASGIVAAAGTLIVLVAAWLLTSFALAQMLAHRLDLPGARRTLPRALLSLGIADACLLGAVVVVTAIAGNVPLGALEGAAEELSATSIAGFEAATLASLLIVLAALGRCAQAPFGTWLTQTVAAPTPVSALLHAGIVNAGAVLLIATAPLVTASGVAMGLLFAVAAFSMLNATSLMIARPDVKGALALSTRGQMAFMLLACAMGAFGAAIFHLVAHGMYKATLFLGSGTAIDESRQIAGAPHSVIPPARGARAVRQAILSLILPLLLLSLAVAVISPGLLTSPGGVVLLLFAWASAAQATWWWLRIREPAGGARMLALGALAAATFAYVALLAATKDLLAADLPTPGEAVVPGLLLAPVLGIALAATAMRWLAAASATPGAPTGRIGALQRRAYARALSAGSWPPRRPVVGPSRWLGGRKLGASRTPLKVAP